LYISKYVDGYAYLTATASVVEKIQYTTR